MFLRVVLLAAAAVVAVFGQQTRLAGVYDLKPVTPPGGIGGTAGDVVFDLQVLGSQSDRVELGFRFTGAKSKQDLLAVASGVKCLVVKSPTDLDCQWTSSMNRVNARGGALDIPSYQIMTIRGEPSGAVVITGGVPGIPVRWRYKGRLRMAANKQ